jgi:hypothetical protein
VTAHELLRRMDEIEGLASQDQRMPESCSVVHHVSACSPSAVGLEMGEKHCV